MMKSADETRPVKLALSQQKCPTHFRRAIIRNNQNNSLKCMPKQHLVIVALLAFAPQSEAGREYITIFRKVMADLDQF
jgi:hypothetical protein